MKQSSESTKYPKDVESAESKEEWFHDEAMVRDRIIDLMGASKVLDKPNRKKSQTELLKEDEDMPIGFSDSSAAVSPGEEKARPQLGDQQVNYQSFLSSGSEGKPQHPYYQNFSPGAFAAIKDGRWPFGRYDSETSREGDEGYHSHSLSPPEDNAIGAGYKNIGNSSSSSRHPLARHQTDESPFSKSIATKTGTTLAETSASRSRSLPHQRRQLQSHGPETNLQPPLPYFGDYGNYGGLERFGSNYSGRGGDPGAGLRGRRHSWSDSNSTLQLPIMMQSPSRGRSPDPRDLSPR
jgi:hypothetical protein